MNELLWTSFDIIGTVAFAISGAILGIMRRMDIFGVTVLAVATAIGGGVVRDVLVGTMPPTALQDTTNFIISVTTAQLFCLAYRVIHTTTRQRWLLSTTFTIADTIGLAAFTVTGTLIGMHHVTVDPVTLPLILGVTTAVGGGIIRDVLAKTMPTVLHADVYATAAIVGSLVITLTAIILNTNTAAWLGFTATIVIRACAVCFHWRIYHPEQG